MKYDCQCAPHNIGLADVGERVCFLNRNGYDTELACARECLAEGEVLTVEDVSIGGWTSSYRFKETNGQWFNTVMFEPLAQAIEARRAETRSGSVADESAVRQDVPKGESRG